MVDAIQQLPCGSIWSWHFRGDSLCQRWKAAEAFSFLSAIVWLVSALVGIWFTFRVRGETTEGTYVILVYICRLLVQLCSQIE